MSLRDFFLRLFHRKRVETGGHWWNVYVTNTLTKKTVIIGPSFWSESREFAMNEAQERAEIYMAEEVTRTGDIAFANYWIEACSPPPEPLKVIHTKEERPS